MQPRMQSWVVFRERYLVSKGAESILTRFSRPSGTSPWLRSVPRTSVLGYFQVAPSGLDLQSPALTQTLKAVPFNRLSSAWVAAGTGSPNDTSVQCRAYGARILWLEFPALPGWADVWRPALRAFSLNLPPESQLLRMTFLPVSWKA